MSDAKVEEGKFFSDYRMYNEKEKSTLFLLRYHKTKNRPVLAVMDKDGKKIPQGAPIFIINSKFGFNKPSSFQLYQIIGNKEDSPYFLDKREVFILNEKNEMLEGGMSFGFNRWKAFVKVPLSTDVVTDSDGNYSIQLPPGKYFLVARMRKTGEIAGPLEVGDIKSEVIGPIIVKENGETIKTNIKVFEKRGESKDIAIEGDKREKKTVISGYIFDADGKPVQNARVHVYDHVQMSERPKFVSTPTGPDGKYSIALPKGGTYYLAARDKFGGPPKVGDLYGRYDKGTIEPSAVSIRDNETLQNINITVHRVW